MINTVFNLDGIDFLEKLYSELGENSVDMFLCDFPYTFDKKRRVTANKWDVPIDDKKFFELALKLLKPNGNIVLTATNPFAAYLIYNHLKYFKYEWIWEKDNGTNFVSVKYQPFRVHEHVLVFGTAPTSYNKNNNNMYYNPQFTISKPYKTKKSTKNYDSKNLSYFKGRTESVSNDGKRYPRSIQKFNSEKGYHPTQKPVNLYSFLIKSHCPENGLLVDICCGSGTSAISCIDNNVNYILNELDKDFYLVTLKRIAEKKLKNF